MNQEEVIRMALEALEWNYNTDLDNIPACEQWAKMLKKTIVALRQAIEQAEQQEPVAWANPHDLQNFDMKVRTNGGPLHTVPLYTAPPRKPLTDEHILLIANRLWEIDIPSDSSLWFARAIEAAHGIKEKTMDEGYYCVVCCKYIEAVDGVIVHDDIPHPYMAFDDEANPQ